VRRACMRSCHRFCRDADAYVTDFKAANARIDAVCRSISELSLVAVEPKRLYAQAEFQDVQVGLLGSKRVEASVVLGEQQWWVSGRLL
jgi:hypothetical protein